MLSQELGDVEGEAKACHFLGYAHYCLGNYKEAVRYYDQDLALARDQQVVTWLPDGYSQIFRSYVFGPSGLKDYGSATLRCKI